MITRFFLLLFLVAFVGVEMAITANETVGIILYFVILFNLILLSAVAREDQSHRLFLALGLVPLIRIVSLAVPVGEISEIYWYAIIVIPVFVGIITVMRALDLNPADVGLSGKRIPVQVLVAAGGLGIGAVDYLILEPDSLITSLTIQKALVPALILLVSTGLVEELAFRGVMQRAAQASWAWGWVYIAAVYTALQIGHESALHCLFTFGVMLGFGWVVKKTGSILGVSLSHGLLNIGLYLIFPHVL